MNKVYLKRVVKEREILVTSGIAHVIWREHYAPILSSAQIEYMLEEFQSSRAIARAIADGYEYFLLRRMGVYIGYTAIKVNDPLGKLFLSKIYLLCEYRGKGYAADVVAQLDDTARRLRLAAIWLTVNKQNPSIERYKKMGFTIDRELVTDIGGGYMMDDYVMERTI